MASAAGSGSYDLSLRGRVYHSRELCREAHQPLAHNAMLRDELRAVAAEAARTRRRSRYVAPRPIAGGADDLGLVIAVLAGGSAMCTDCIANQTDIPHAEISLLMVRAHKRFRVETPNVPCTVCGTTRRVYRLHEPGASDLRLVMVALWNERLCLRCLVARTRILTARMEEILATLGRVVRVTTSAADCEGCSTVRDVLTLI